jgi:predicted TIM-barrel fold metal-dependent hydrolase
MDHDAPLTASAASHVSDFAADSFEPVGIKAISADSHITEPPNCYSAYIDPAYRDRAPHMVTGPNGGDVFVIDGIDKPIPMAIIAAAGINPREIRLDESKFEDLHRGGWDPVARIADQERDGIAGEVIYPSIGMVLCNHPDGDYKNACFKAYNRWLEEFVSHDRDRLYGIGQTAVRSVEEAVSDFQEIKAAGFKGVMMPCDPATEEDYDDPTFDPLWQAASDLQLPISFHILTSGRGSGTSSVAVSGRGGNGRPANGQHGVIRANQDVISMFIWGRVFERFPNLKLVCVEADAGWAPHFMYRLDHFYNRHRFWSKLGDMAKLPSEQFADNVYLTFQDDFVAFNSVDMMNPRRLMWANDFPHSDSTWPWSQQLLARHTAKLSQEQKEWILRDNVAELYNLDLAS